MKLKHEKEEIKLDAEKELSSSKQLVSFFGPREGGKGGDNEISISPLTARTVVLLHMFSEGGTKRAILSPGERGT